MMPENQLWSRIQAFQIDDGSPALTFEARLARENGWTLPFAKRVVDEYKRFTYLAMTAGHVVTPSEEVDQAWHMHLTYTRSYWERFCGGVLGKSLHHDPTRGGRAESTKFANYYEKTLQSYTEAFGHHPPQDIWPNREGRFQETSQASKHTSDRVSEVNRSHVTAVLATSGLILIAAWMMHTHGTTAQTPITINKAGFEVVAVVLVCLVVIGVLRALKSLIHSPSRTRHDGGGCASATFFWGHGNHSDEGHHDGQGDCGQGDAGGDSSGGDSSGGDSGCGGGCGGGD